MRIIICGAGQVGYHIAKQLSREGNEVILIDKDEELIRKINDHMDVKAVCGWASHPNTLHEVGAADADMLIAVTYSDEVNMVACQIAHSLFNVPTKIARIRNQNYLIDEWNHLYRHDHLPIDVIISPEIEVGDAILRRLHVPGALDMIPFVEDKLRVLAVRCEANSPIINLPLHLAANRMDKINMSILGVIHGEKFELPRTEMILKEDDTVYIVCDTQHTRKALALFGHEEYEARRIVILGGGNIGAYIAKTMEEEDQTTRVKLIEVDRERAEQVARSLDATTVINGSGLDRDILMESGIDQVETILAVTNDDKVNILASLLAKRLGCKRSIALVNNYSYIPMLGNLGVDIIVNPRETTVSSILQHVRRGKIRTVHSIHDGAAEIIEAEAVATSPLVGKPISDLKLPKGVLIGAIICNGNQFVIPEDDTVIHEGDRVIILSSSDAVKKVEKFFSVSLEFF